jgi:anaphase-promoting complex subunit 6
LNCQFENSLKLTTKILHKDPFCKSYEVLSLHIANLYQLGKTNQLFQLGHQLVEHSPDLAVTWFAVACYYLATLNFEEARRYFAKATTMDPLFSSAWLG